MEGNMRGPSSLDCEKSFARTGIPSANMLAKKRQQEAKGNTEVAWSQLVHIQLS